MHCHDMKKGQILVCEDCGLELQVISECKECGGDSTSCGCEEDCEFSCCGDPMIVK